MEVNSHVAFKTLPTQINLLAPELFFNFGTPCI